MARPWGRSTQLATTAGPGGLMRPHLCWPCCPRSPAPPSSPQTLAMRVFHTSLSGGFCARIPPPSPWRGQCRWPSLHGALWDPSHRGTCREDRPVPSRAFPAGHGAVFVRPQLRSRLSVPAGAWTSCPEQGGAPQLWGFCPPEGCGPHLYARVTGARLPRRAWSLSEP